MKERKIIAPEALRSNTFEMIGKDWMLITASNGEKTNTMTASWGGFGVLWNKPVCFCFVRPQRYTHEFTEQSDRLTLSFFGGEYKKELGYCGRTSGRDTDKIADCGFDEIKDGEYSYFDQAKIVICARKLYRDVLREDGFVDRELLSNYSAGDYHTVYVCEIEKVLVAE